jgi:hypothetical protein
MRISIFVNFVVLMMSGTPAPAATPPASTAPAATGLLFVSSRPWSQLTLDGAAAGRTNWKREIPVGRHDLVLRTESGEQARQSVVVSEGEPTAFCWDFELKAPCPR